MSNTNLVRRFFYPLLALLLFSATSILTPGCQEDSRVNTIAPYSVPETPDNSPSLSTEYIGSSGGTVVGPNSTFVVPADALSTTVAITMLYQSSLADEVVMGPSGQTFAEGCTLTMDKPSGYDPNVTYHIYLWDPTTSTWDDQGGVDNGSTVSTTIWHFSKYKVDEAY
ncbi:MAG: hypothetical protein R3E97_12135 [Candidatus Eisenbacteria bacterium]